MKKSLKIFNCSRTKFDAIIVNLFVFFYAKFSLGHFDFSSDFYAPKFFILRISISPSLTSVSSWTQVPPVRFYKSNEKWVEIISGYTGI